MECDFDLLCYELFKIQKTIIILKILLNISLKNSMIFLFIASCFEIRDGKKCYFQYHLNIHILN